MKSMGKSLLLPIALCAALLEAPALSLACDTWVALPDATAGGFTILAKNSDRPLFDCQPLVLNPRRRWPAGSELDLGRITMPQVEETYATLGSSPYWCWGYEEGINEYGVAIGNEGVRTKPLRENIASYTSGEGPELGPTGMDLVRLALERGRTARQALDVIVSLLGRYGQFGSGIPGAGPEGAYDNSYIIADHGEAWVLETAGQSWAARRFPAGTTSISNKLSIGTGWDIASPGLVDRAVEKGWWDGERKGEFNFSAAYSDDSPEGRAGMERASVRESRSRGLLEKGEGKISPFWMMWIARDRSSEPGIDLDQTASSCVAVLPGGRKDLPVFWWCPAVPSSSCYVPFFVHGNALPGIVSAAGKVGRAVERPSSARRDAFSPESYWWLFRDLCDKTKADRGGRNPIVRAEFDALEREFAEGLPAVLKKASRLKGTGRAKRAAAVLDGYTGECVEKTIRKLNGLRERFGKEEASVADTFDAFVGRYTAAFGRFRNAVFEVKVQNGKLAVDIPGQMVVELEEPDDEGKRRLALTPDVAFSFESDEAGRVRALRLHQATPIPRTEAGTPGDSSGVPERYSRYVAKYAVTLTAAEFEVLVREDHLALRVPDGNVIDLGEPDEKGWWYFLPRRGAAVAFERDAAGRVTAMKLHQTFRLPKGLSAAFDIEVRLEGEGLESAMARYEILKAGEDEDYYFSETEFNAVGYRLLRDGKIGEAIAILRLNVEAYPDSWNVYDSLGEAYMTKGEKRLAIECYRKALELNPENMNARGILEKLEAGE